MRLALTLLLFADVVLATGVFIAMARPDVVIAFAIRTLGIRDDWFQEHIADEELGRLRLVMKVGTWAGVGFLFASSFGLGIGLRLL
ncbi:MAG: hypothetical protein VX899_04810 [Myxococcota bacterium]|nr:hypothetical protein [Myxococcota bacterium]